MRDFAPAKAFAIGNLRFAIARDCKVKSFIAGLSVTEKELLQRTKSFALRVIKLVAALPKNSAGHAIGNQLIHSGTSVAANYRAACRGRSKAEFISKLGTVEEEADESALRMELIMESKLMKESLVEGLWREAVELTKIMAASKISARKNVQ